jgi:hypothetical protein
MQVLDLNFQNYKLSDKHNWKPQSISHNWMYVAIAPLMKTAYQRAYYAQWVGKGDHETERKR